MKKLIIFLTIFFTISLNLQNIILAKETKNKPPSVTADGAILIDATTGKILYSKNIDTPYPPASTTKLMTALLTFENCDLDEKITVGKKPPLADGSKIFIRKEEVLTVRQLLYALLLVSGNDCAEALAEHIGGSIENFAKMMNEKAKEIGCENTNFVNPSGLYNANHRTTARDLSLIMKELINYPQFTTIATTESYKILPTNKCKECRPLGNENRLIQKYSKYHYDGCIGGKTGYTIESWHSYVAAASRNNQKLIVVFLHDTKKTFFHDAVALLNYGFNNFSLEKLYNKGDLVDTLTINENYSVPLLAKDDFYYVKNKDSVELPQLTINENSTLSSKSFIKGDIITKGTITYENKTLNTIELTIGCNYAPKKDIVETTSKKIKNNSLYIRNFIVTIIMFLLLFSIIHLKNKHKRKIKNFYNKK